MSSRALSQAAAAVALLLGVPALAAPASAGPASASLAPTIWTVAGTGDACQTAPDCGDGSAATAATVGLPQAVAVDGAGDVYIADMGDNEVRKLSPSGVITIVAGDGSVCATAPACGDGGPATAAQLNAPDGVAVDARGNVVIADSGDDEIREVTRQGTITRVAGTGTDCTSAACGDGRPATSAALSQPDGVALDRRGELLVADTGDQRIRRIDSHGTITTVAGDGTPCAGAPACGDGGPATSAQLSFPESLAVDARGNLYIADNGDQEIRRIDTHGVITRFAGTGQACATAPSCGDGGAAARAALNLPAGVTVDGTGTVYVADWGDNEVRAISPRGTITRLAGDGVACAALDACANGGSGSAAALSSPNGVAVDAAGDVYVADTSDNAVRLVPGRLVAAARAGSAALLTFSASVRSAAVGVRFVLNTPARLSLSVRSGRGAPLLIEHVSEVAGQGELDWNRRLGRRAAPHGLYTLTVAARFGRTLVWSSIPIKL